MTLLAVPGGQEVHSESFEDRKKEPGGHLGSRITSIVNVEVAAPNILDVPRVVPGDAYITVILCAVLGAVNLQLFPV